MHYALMETPLGALTLGSTPRGLALVHFGNRLPKEAKVEESPNRVFIRQLEEYFSNQRTEFDLPLDMQGTPFQMAVWCQLQKIPYGETRSYGEIARSIGKSGAARAVGMANHENPIAVVIPCHRVVGQNGSLTGYAGGVHLKAQLLSIERRHRTLFT